MEIEISLFMGMILGFLLGIGFCIFFTDTLAYRFIKIVGKPKNNDDRDDDDPVNYWKPKGWKPDKEL